MSAEMSATVLGVVSILLAFAGAFGWMVHRTDAQIAGVRGEIAGLRSEVGDGFASVRGEMREEFAAVRGEMREGFGAVRGEISGLRGETRDDLGGVRGEVADTRRELGARMDKMTEELVEVKIAVARVEGPPRHLITGR